MTAQAQTAPKTAEKSKAPNGQKAETAAETAETESKRRGVIPTMPMAIVYRHAGKVHAVIHHPLDGSTYAESGKGEGSAKGALEDSGFRLSSLSLDGPEWLAAKLPEGAELIGYATLKSFPLPTK